MIKKLTLLLSASLALVACSPKENDAPETQNQEETVEAPQAKPGQPDHELVGEEDTSFVGEVSNFHETVDDLIQYSVDHHIALLQGQTDEPMEGNENPYPAVFHGYFGVSPEDYEEFADFVEASGASRQDDNDLSNEEDAMILVHVHLTQKEGE